MNSEVIDFLRELPPVYAAGDKAFWDDEHISKGMLAAHLDADSDGASRRLETIRRSAAWISQYCGSIKGKRLLDLGCGPGLYSELLHDMGASVTGIDLSRRSIEYARSHARETGREIDYRCQNYLEMDSDDEFDIAILVYYDYGVLPPHDRKALLGKVYKALKNDGVFILDVLNETYLDSFCELQSVNYEKEGFWSPEPHVVIQRNVLYRETGNSLERYLVITEDKTERFNIWNQAYSKEAFISEMADGSFKARGIFDDICGNAFTGQAEGICGAFTKD